MTTERRSWIEKISLVERHHKGSNEKASIDAVFLNRVARCPWRNARLCKRMRPILRTGWPNTSLHKFCVATEPLVGFDGQSCCASLSAEDTRRSCIPCGSSSSMEQPTVTCHIIFIVGVFQAQPQDWAVPEIVRWSLISADAPRHFFDFVTCPRSQHWFTSR